MSSPDNSFIGPKRATHGMVAELVQQAKANHRETIKRAQDSRDLAAGRLKPWVSPKLRGRMAGIDRAMVPLPERLTKVLKLAGMIGDRLPEAKRNPVALGGESDEVASAAEQIGNRLLDWYPYYQTVDIGLNEGACGMIASPASALSTGRLPQAYDYATPDDLAALEAEIRAQYEPDPRVKGRSRRFKREYLRDETGARTADRRKADREKTARAYKDALDLHLARRAPLVYRPISPLEGWPIAPRFVGTGVEIQGLVLEQRFTRIELIRRKFRSPKLGYTPSGTMSMLEPDALYGDVTLQEAWLWDEEDRPYVAYSIDGEKCWRVSADGEECETIDLADEFGLRTLPVGWSYFWHFAAKAPDDRAIPYPTPYIGSWLSREKLAALMLYHAEQTSFMGWAYKPDPEAVKLWANSDKPPTIDMEPLSFIPVPGDLTDIVHRGSGPEAPALLHLLDSDAESEGVSAAALGGAGASSSIERSVIGRDTMLGLSAVRKGALQLASTGISHGWEILCAMGEHFEEPIRLSINPTVPIAQGESPSSRKGIITVDPELAGGNYELKAIIPTRPEDNLPMIQVLSGLHSQGKITTRQLLEWGFGDPAPHITMAELEGEEFRRSPIGKQRTLLRLVKYTGDRQTQELLKLYAQGSINTDGLPKGLSAGLQSEPMPGAGGGGAAGNPVQSQVAGLKGGAMMAGPIKRIGAAGGNTSGLLTAGQGG